MTNLEFINKWIELTKAQIKRHPSEQLNILLQIKTDLEAWEVAKTKRVNLLDIELSFDIENYNEHLGNQYRLTEAEYEKLKKALEVKE